MILKVSLMAFLCCSLWACGGGESSKVITHGEVESFQSPEPTPTASPISLVEIQFSVTGYTEQLKLLVNSQITEVEGELDQKFSFFNGREVFVSIDEVDERFHCVISDAAFIADGSITNVVVSCDLRVSMDDALQQMSDAALSNCILENSDADFVDEVESLTCNQQGIESTAGLELFNQLRRLSLRDNNLNTISLNALDNLIELNLSGNALTEVDVSNLSRLRQLRLNDNQISVISLQNNIALETLELSDNELSQILIPSLELLEEINLANNRLEDIDLTRNTNLVALNLSNNPLTQWTGDITFLNILKTLTLNNVSLENLSFDGNFIIENLSLVNVELLSLDISSLQSLVELNVSNNALTELDLTHNSALRFLRANQNKLTSISGLESLEGLLVYDVRDNLLNSSFLPTNNNLQVLSINNNQRMGELGINLGLFPNLEIADLKNIGLRSWALINHSYLERLDLSDNLIDIGPDTSIISAAPRLKSLSIANNSIRSINLLGMPALESVDISRNPINQVDLSAQTALRFYSGSVFPEDNTALTALDELILIESLNTELDLRGMQALSRLELRGMNRLEQIKTDDSYPVSFLRMVDAPALDTIDWAAFSGAEEVILENVSTLAVGFSLFEYAELIHLIDLAEQHIDLTELSNLRNLRVVNNANLASVVLPANSGLQTVELSNNQLDELSLAGNTEITRLDVRDNQLSQIPDGINGLEQPTAIILLDNNSFSAQVEEALGVLQQQFPNLSF